MDKTALALYLYMGSSQPIIDWLKTEGVKTKSQAKEKLAPLVQSNVYSWASHVGSGRGGSVSLAGTSNCIDKVLKYFPESVEENKKFCRFENGICAIDNPQAPDNCDECDFYR